MNLILFSQREGRARQLNLAHPVTLGVVGVLALGILGTAFALGMKLGQRSGAAMHHGDSAQWATVLANQRKRDHGSARAAAGAGRRDGDAARPGQRPRDPAGRAGQAPHGHGEHRSSASSISTASRRPAALKTADGVGAEIPDLTGLLDQPRAQGGPPRRPARRPRKRHPLPRPHPADPPRRQADQVGASFRRISASARTRSAAMRRSTAASTSPVWRAPKSSPVAAGRGDLGGCPVGVRLAHRGQPRQWLCHTVWPQPAGAGRRWATR